MQTIAALLFCLVIYAASSGFAQWAFRLPFAAVSSSADYFFENILGWQKAQAQSSPQEQTKYATAALVFLEFYYVNTKYRQEYCENLGVDITPFTSGFAAQNETDYHKATNILDEVHLNLDTAVHIVERDDVKMKEATDTSMTDIANKLPSGTTTMACQIVASHPEVFLPEMTFRNHTTPLIFEALNEGQHQ